MYTPPAPSLSPLMLLVEPAMQQVNATILSSALNDVQLIEDIGRHIIAAGGKRLRPALVLASADMCGYGQAERAIALAAAVELLHTATLLHDDVVDESTMRRGDPTANAIWSNQASVLVGDFLLSRAFQLMVADGSLDTLRLLSDASAMISRGEVMQLMHAQDLTTTEEQYFAVIAAKTSPLFSAATEIGALLSGNEAYRAPTRAFGHTLGLLFQLVDDALDYSATQQQFGKSVGDDLREGKVTLPIIHLYAHATTQEQAFLQEIFGVETVSDAQLKQVLDLIHQYGSLRYTLEQATLQADAAKSALYQLPDCPARACLLEAVDFCMTRGY